MSTETAPAALPEAATTLRRLKTSDTPHLDALDAKDQVFVLTLYLTENMAKSAREAGYPTDYGRKLAIMPRIERALQEQREAPTVHPLPTDTQIISRLWVEAQNLSSNPASRVSALKALADIKGLTGGQGNTGSSELSDFLKGVKGAVVAGAFDGAKEAGRKAVEGAVEDAGAREGDGVTVEAVGVVVEPGEDLASAVPALREKADVLAVTDDANTNTST